MPELLLELLSEEIPARMQARAAEDLKRLVCDGLAKADSPSGGGLRHAAPSGAGSPRFAGEAAENRLNASSKSSCWCPGEPDGSSECWPFV